MRQRGSERDGTYRRKVPWAWEVVTFGASHTERVLVPGNGRRSGVTVFGRERSGARLKNGATGGISDDARLFRGLTDNVAAERSGDRVAGPVKVW